MRVNTIPEESNHVLVVDDQFKVVKAHANSVSELGYQISQETESVKVLDRLNEEPSIELVLLDIRMPEMNGLELLRLIKRNYPQIGVIMATVVNDIEYAVLAIKQGAYNYLLKPLKSDRLKEALDSYFANKPKTLVIDGHFSSFITQCDAFHEIFRRMASFAQANVTVLIEGETGTGKELIAETLHALAQDPKKKSFITVNMAALSDSLFESELFGHLKGSFTGATKDKIGYLEAAGAGTIFLDEIGELGAEQQKKLLRVLQSRKFIPVGDTKERNLEARIIAATNRNLKKMVADGTFREDLYYRLASHIVEVPPLRDRGDDIILLSNYFFQKYCAQYGRILQGFTNEALEVLCAYSYPGNVRELEGIVSSMVLLEQEPKIQVESVPIHMRNGLIIDDDGDMDLETIKYRAIMSTLVACDGNQTMAAEKLGIARGSLNRILKAYRDKEKSE